MNMVDLTGKKFGSWVVKWRSRRNDPWGRAMWGCECECGTTAILRGDNLRRGKTTGCQRCMMGKVIK